MNQADKEQLEDWDRRHVWHPFTPMQAWADERPLIVAEARGCLLVDLDGREYVDGVSSLWCNVHGHRVPQIDQAVREQLDRVARRRTSRRKPGGWTIIPPAPCTIGSMQIAAMRGARSRRIRSRETSDG